MRAISPSSVILSIIVIKSRAECRHPNGLKQTDPYHAPCSDVLNNPLNTMCCAIERPNPPGGYSTNGLNADVCLPNGLCQQSWKRSENSTVTTEYYREECTFDDWSSGKCLSVCLSNSVSRNVMMTPCDDTANSTRWCCGKDKDCCAGDIGVETLAQTFLGMATSSTSAPLSSTTISVPDPSSTATMPPNPDSSSPFPGSAIAGIVIGVLVGIALIGTIWFIVAHRRRSIGHIQPVYVEEGHAAGAPKTSYAHEADAMGPQVCEVSASNAKDHDGRSRVYEM